MNNTFFIKRIFTNKIYWLSAGAAIILLLCSIIYTDPLTGEKYTFVSLFYDEVSQEALEYGMISMANIFLWYDTSYLWMFCPIIVGIPCIINNKTERLVLFRTSKNKYILSKYFANLFASGVLILLAYVVFSSVGMAVVKENIWNEYLVKKMLSVFCWGVFCAIPSIILSEIVHNKYLILCIPFVFNYFMLFFADNILPNDIGKYVKANTYEILFLNESKTIGICVSVLLVLILLCAILKKIIIERRCDCGQR